MKKVFIKKHLVQLAVTAALFNLSSQAFASDFNLPFYNAAGLGNVYSGWAVSAEDASTAYANPAGLTNITNQQLVIAGVASVGHTYFEGSTTPPFPPTGPQTGRASSNLFGPFPSIYYAAPLSNTITLGFSETVPFGVGANYPKDSVVRYASTRSQISAIDLGPSIGFKVNDKLSAGFGLDAARLTLIFNNMIGQPFSTPDSESQNNLSGWGYGWHGGLLYQLTQSTRLGVSYNSNIFVKASGSSALYAMNAYGANWRTTNQRANFTLPSHAQFSVKHDFNSLWSVMGTIFYTNWGAINQVTLKNVMYPGGTTAGVTVPLNYHNTFDYAAGVDFKPSTKWILRGGVELLQTPTNNQTRLVSDPFGGATVLALGAHYQQNRNLGYDVGYAHPFFYETKYNNVTPISSVSGHSTVNVNVFGAQVTWNFV